MYKVIIQDIEKGDVLIDEEVRGIVMTSLPANQLGKSIGSLDKPTQLLLALYLKAMREKGDTDNGTDEII